MTAIYSLSTVADMSLSDFLALYSLSGGYTGKVTVGALLEVIQANLALPGTKVTQYAAPSATGFTAAVVDSSDSVWLILTPAAGFAAGTVKLPSLANAVDGQEVSVNCTQAVTTLTVDGSGATVTGAPTTLSANAFFTLRFDETSKVWYRVG